MHIVLLAMNGPLAAELKFRGNTALVGRIARDEPHEHLQGKLTPSALHACQRHNNYMHPSKTSL